MFAVTAALLIETLPGAEEVGEQLAAVELDEQ